MFFVDLVRMACNYGLFCRRRKRVQEEGDENAPKKKRFCDGVSVINLL